MTTKSEYLPIRPKDGARILNTEEEAIDAAHELAASWAKSGPLRDLDRKVPHVELEELSRSGLLAIMNPRSFGGLGARAGTLTRVFSILSGADAALAQVPQNHFGAIFGLELDSDEERRAFFYNEVLHGARFGNAPDERKGGPRLAPQNAFVREGEGFVLNGNKRFCTGALTADWVPTSGQHPDGTVGTAFLRQGTPGLVINEDWDAFGQRATVSGTAVLTDVWVHERFVGSSAQRSKATTAFRYSRSQLTHSAIELGVAESLLSWSEELDDSKLSPDARSRLDVWKEEVALDIRAALVLIDRAAGIIDDIVAAGEVSDDAALDLGIAVDESKCIAYELGPFAANGLMELLGPEFADEDLDVDRYWRNARTHSLHDPVRWRRHYVGDFHLNGTPPPFLKWLIDTRGDSPL